jgi:hypothetical protein
MAERASQKEAILFADNLLRTYVRRGKRGQEVKEDLARVQGETTGGG